MEKSLIDEAVSTLDLQGSNVKESTVEDKDLQAGASAGDAQQPNSEENKDEAPEAVPMKLTKGMICTIFGLLETGYTFGRIKINRDIDAKQVKKKIASILACKGIISPFLVVPAIVCLKTGLELEDENGNPITEDTPNLDLILIVIDGQHRMEALRQLNKKLKKEGKTEYEGYVYLPLISEYDVPTLLREANSATNPWDGMDWVTQLLATAKEKGIATEKLEWVKDKAKKGSDSAAWAWVNGGKTNSKATCINASTDNQKLQDLANTDSFEEDKKLYEAASKSFKGNSKKVLGWKVLPEWTYKQLDSFIKKDMKRSDAISVLVAFLESIGTTDAEEISQMKKNANQSKDNMIITKLNELFADFNLKH